MLCSPFLMDFLISDRTRRNRDSNATNGKLSNPTYTSSAVLSPRCENGCLLKCHFFILGKAETGAAEMTLVWGNSLSSPFNSAV